MPAPNKKMWISYLIIVGAAAVISAGPVSFINKCAVTDSKCIKQSTAVAIPIIAAGIPELGVKSVDPLIYKKLDASNPSLKLILTDVTVVGLKNCTAKKMKRDAATSKLEAKLICDLKIDGHYDMSGRLLILPIQGNGKIHIGLNKIQINVDTVLSEVDEDGGKKYWELKNTNYSYKLTQKADLIFENLFPGNELLAQAARELVKTSSNEIINEVGVSIINKNIMSIINSVGQFLRSIPVEDLSL